MAQLTAENWPCAVNRLSCSSQTLTACSLTASSRSMVMVWRPSISMCGMGLGLLCGIGRVSKQPFFQVGMRVRSTTVPRSSRSPMCFKAVNTRPTHFVS